MNAEVFFILLALIYNNLTPKFSALKIARSSKQAV